MFDFAKEQTPLRQNMTVLYREDEALVVNRLANELDFSEQATKIEAWARGLITEVRAKRQKMAGVDALMHEFSLSSEEGVALMCLAEALLRVPDKHTQTLLIRDKLSRGDWKSHVGQGSSLFVNAAAWGLLLTGKMTQPATEQSLSSALNRMISKGGESMIRKGMDYAMRMLGQQFVTGQTIDEALKNGVEREGKGYRFSFDMLGEAAMTQLDAERYYQDYINAIHAIGRQSLGRDVYDSNGISVKLSALHPRYHRNQHARVMKELLPKVKYLYVLAKQYNIGLNIDAEESYRLDISLDLLEAIALDEDLKGFEGIGFVVQAYQKRCPAVLDFIIDLARRSGHRFMIRLVKGAYWDSEIKLAQVEGLEGYPVYTRKVHTDVAYLACAQKLLGATDVVFPQFASHNAYTVAAIRSLGGDKDFEFQCLHGMGETLYDQVVGENNWGRRVRIYAPVGTHETLLAYLVRRLLENGANSSFVNQIVDETIDIDSLVQNPLLQVAQTGGLPHPAIALPAAIYGNGRVNSRGLDLSNEAQLLQLQDALNQEAQKTHHIASITAEEVAHHPAHPVLNPANHHEVIGEVSFIKVEAVADVIQDAIQAQFVWQGKSVAERSKVLRATADLLEANQNVLLYLAIKEAGKTLTNAVGEIREAVDFCRYYAQQTEEFLPQHAKSRGVMVAISPWNFPLAIFVGQVVAALAAGNVVIAKPAEQTSLIAHAAVTLMLAAGVPDGAVQLVLGEGDVGAALTADERVEGVLFTGSTEVAQLINRGLAKREDMPLLLAETGGQNAMIVDSTALPEQVVQDVLLSAFDSAGQRCSALRVLCLQDDIADRVITMLKGGLKELRIGNPAQLNVDIGPVIDEEAQQRLLAYIDSKRSVATQVTQWSIAPELAAQGTFVPPTILELKHLGDLSQEVFGPVLHVVRFKAHQLDQLIDQINQQNYALTHGIHSRIDGQIEYIASRIEAGNVYVNRNIVGAVVGVQPFGGHHQSGTGPKAGGPFYLQRLSLTNPWRLPEGSEVGQAAVNVNEQAQKLGITVDERMTWQAHVTCVLNSLPCSSGILLKGPTGETNSLNWHVPKHVLIDGGDELSVAALAAVLQASGSQVFLSANHRAASRLAKMGVKTLSEAEMGSKPIDVCVGLSKVDVALKTLLAKRSGALVKWVDLSQGLDVAPLLHEVSRSTNTAAAGGNAALMTLQQ
ncbi:bifunctional proline dehydrogenase/L-glutamate gamma-semialdehyde dehydrogenase PutA [Vitreoscilla stercoraria]|uniref:Bifunctional protein PutA n=1 Tax=Vitreoscilla stercoraria TaxID=61 RepID=A0ABY4E8C7_VITST|nr:bifunctional proline dehydrogenase/L-glutamate gamma-semialdehyde dehydrogenase PutA [Vitreoscilla stercoraria]UOO91596.1 bifunctional proline dehydrogenase/L-glutamate gamma-semialdehyde dehydrogenase PutA [Vitreoscilla stercoraria]